MRNFLLTGMAFLLSSAFAVAQTQYCIGGSLDKLTPAQITACKAKSADLHNEAQRQGEPRNWHFVVVCDEAGWSEYASFVGLDREKLANVLQKSEPATRLTVVRGSRLQSGDMQKLDVVIAEVKQYSGTVATTRRPAGRPSMLPVAQVNRVAALRR